VRSEGRSQSRLPLNHLTRVRWMAISITNQFLPKPEGRP
jgi:hypothetical protein